MSKWKVAFPTRSPENPEGEGWTTGIHPDKFTLLLKSGHEAKLARLILVGEVLSDPILILEGWDRPDKDGCFVYAGKPKHDFRKVSIETPAPPGYFFLVFVLPDGTIDDWTWRAPDKDDPTTPEGTKGTKIWPKI